jgi:hypothetical protein
MQHKNKLSIRFIKNSVIYISCFHETKKRKEYTDVALSPWGRILLVTGESLSLSRALTLLNRKFRCRSHKSSSLLPVLFYMNSDHIGTPHIIKIVSNITLSSSSAPLIIFYFQVSILTPCRHFSSLRCIINIPSTSLICSP